MTSLIIENKDKCLDCGSTDLHFLKWVNSDDIIMGVSADEESGRYWCENCKDNKDGGTR